MNSPTRPSATLPQIDIEPLRALVDEPVLIRLAGFEARQQVTLRAQMTDHFGNAWESRATFITNELGWVDLSTQKPISGTYDQTDLMGLFWSMVLPAGAEIAVRRLAAHRFPFPVEHLSYPDAGHLIFFPPYGPTTIRYLRHPVLKQVFNYGGTTAGDAFARADSWPKVLKFLRSNLT